MNREQKIALIVGFSLVLLVGVLISDHFSGARSARVERVASSETPIADLGAPPLREPAIVASLPQPTPSGSPATGVTATPTDPAPVAQGPLSSGAQSAAGEPPATAPVTEIVQGRDPRRAGDSLAQAVAAAGGAIRDGVIVLPPASGVDSRKDEQIKATLSPPVAPLGVPTTISARPPTPAGPVVDPLKKPAATHVVKPGETLSKIASQYYGTGTAWKALAQANPGKVDANGGVRSGVTLVIPPRESRAGAAPKPTTPPTPGVAPRREPAKSEPVRPARIELATYTVKKGDSLGMISQRVLGTARRVQEIMDLNGLDDEDAIEAGKVLKMPAKRG
ncbi:MAG: LysM peptidoglycan-binding domain-containing protein [Phycisphaerae bacterium]|nr:LysM peptidoglycan-binding domain-containing protein [Phycisphaerae bacterium]